MTWPEKLLHDFISVSAVKTSQTDTLPRAIMPYLFTKSETKANCKLTHQCMVRFLKEKKVFIYFLTLSLNMKLQFIFIINSRPS